MVRIYAFFRRFFGTEKQNPQTLSFFGCMVQRFPLLRCMILWNTESDVILSVGKSLFYVDTFSGELFKGHRYILSVIIGH